ncbi:hypothetical protein A2737_00445 [Candidatus Nomurabacteria bacterium RIFCSPHIGHO2_01_FULL_41_71]|nr:MAG: hypothetical protein A2737_00445 [Candidatus Nomurabacteria bacterium RIFCSPHIGHO2_01_FULL_41_71]OGI89507.1 MAG: hypothetical protein A3B01_02365 [Candidatus Nomurabacteria bacterium RIFCSPLOWO2_01_FULL_41_52b]
MRYLGIDYGTKRIGLAVSDLNGRLAFPKEVVKNNGELMRKIGEIISKEKIAEIVVGESLDFAGLPNILQKEIEFFISNLNRKFKLSTHREKEFFTSVEARRYEDKGTSVDASAAALILQRFLDKKNSGNSQDII